MSAELGAAPPPGRRQRLARAVAAALALGNVLLHEPVSDFCRGVEARIGFAALDRGAFLAIAATSVLLAALAAAVLARRHPGPPEPRPLVGLLALAAVTVLAHRYLIVNNIEIIHFPQYALLAGALLAGGLSPRAAWAVASAVGIGDELAQYVQWSGVRPDTYVDTNDMLLDLIGAAWAVVLVLAARGRRTTPAVMPASATAPASAPRRSPTGRIQAALAAVAGLVLLVLDPPGWAVRHGAFERAYYVLSASTAMALGALVLGIVAWSDPAPRCERV
jgi:hypothetical protein